jgi:hypothetical protein
MTLILLRFSLIKLPKTSNITSCFEKNLSNIATRQDAYMAGERK